MLLRRPTWLAWLAILVLIVGGAIAYMFSTQEVDPDAHSKMVLTLAGTILVAGICLVSLTADWWMRH